MKRDHVLFTCVVLAAFFAALFQNNGALSLFFQSPDIHLPDGTLLTRDSEYVGQALSLLRTGTFNNNGREEYIGLARRGPTYSMTLALFFAFFGEFIGAIFLANALFFILALFFLWRIGARLLPGAWWPLLPPFLLGVWPGSVSYVWVFNNETWTLLIITFLAWSFYEWQTKRSPEQLALCAVLAALLAFEKQVAFYLPFVMAAAIFFHTRHFMSRKIYFVSLLTFFSIYASVVGLWSFRNYNVFGSWQIGDGGHSILRRSSQVDFSTRQIISAALSFTIGDYIGQKIYAHYPADGKPISWDPAIDKRWYRKFLDKSISRVERDQSFYPEAFANIKRHPIKFIATSALGFLRLNSPVNHRGQEIMRLFLESREGMRPAVKIAIIAAIHISWGTFLVLIAISFIRRSRQALWAFPLLLIVYFNGMYAFVTHAEVRYLLPVMPFYFLLFSDEVSSVVLRAKKKK